MVHGAWFMDYCRIFLVNNIVSTIVVFIKGADNLKNFLFLIDSNTMSILKNTHKSLI